MKSLFNKFITLGQHPDDQEDDKLRKSTLLLMSTPFALAGFLWGILYFLNGLFLPGLIPFCYGILSILSIVHFSITTKYHILRTSQLFLILILPFALQLSLGGFIPASAVILWAFICPLGAMVFSTKKRSYWWFGAFLLLSVVAYLVNDLLPTYINWNLNNSFIDALFLMNIIGVTSMIFLIQSYFVNNQNNSLVILRNKHQWIKDAFSAYVSPGLVEHLVKHPEDLKLGGDRRVCTFVFTDIAGFTTFVEKSNPNLVVSLMNEYIEELSKIVFKHNGTIDKIVGDGMAIIFSAPVIQKDHAERGVRCALEIDRFSQRFVKAKRSQNIEIGRTRIGVNTGSVIVGNMGSKTKFDYTAIGDAVNTASRLESANKHFGTRICVSQATADRCPRFNYCPIGSLVLKGKSESVMAYEVIDHSVLDPHDVTEYKSAYAMLERTPRRALRAFEKLNGKYLNDGLIAYHLDRLRSGVFGNLIVMESK